MINLTLTNFKKNISFIKVLFLFFQFLRLFFNRRQTTPILLFNLLFLQIINPNPFIKLKPSRRIPFKFHLRISLHFFHTEKPFITPRAFRFKSHPSIHSMLLRKFYYQRDLRPFKELQTTLY